MTIDTDLVLDRRRLRRRLGLWRAGAIFALLLAVGAVAARSNGFAVFNQPQIARISFHGTIVEDRDLLALIKEVGEDDNVKALLLHVNSPGGTTTGGESIFEAVRKVAKVKPVVAQFSTLATSAGYIVGLAADHIVSRGNTITGSVGVLLQWPQITELMNKVGVAMKTVKSGSLKASPNPFEPMDEASRQVAQDMVDDGFRWFLSLVEKRRGINPATVPGLVKGRIFSGRAALGYKLIDEIGGEAEAVRWLQEKRGLDKDVKVVDRQPISQDFKWLGASSQLMGQITAENWASETGRIANAVATAWGFERLTLDGLVSVWHPPEN